MAHSSKFRDALAVAPIATIPEFAREIPTARSPTNIRTIASSKHRGLLSVATLMWMVPQERAMEVNYIEATLQMLDVVSFFLITPEFVSETTLKSIRKRMLQIRRKVLFDYT